MHKFSDQKRSASDRTSVLQHKLAEFVATSTTITTTTTTPATPTTTTRPFFSDKTWARIEEGLIAVISFFLGWLGDMVRAKIKKNKKNKKMASALLL